MKPFTVTAARLHKMFACESGVNRFLTFTNGKRSLRVTPAILRRYLQQHPGDLWWIVPTFNLTGTFRRSPQEFTVARNGRFVASRDANGTGSLEIDGSGHYVYWDLVARYDPNLTRLIIGPMPLTYAAARKAAKEHLAKFNK